MQLRRQVCVQTLSKTCKCKEQHRLLFTFHWMMNDRCKFGKFSRMTRPNDEWDFISRTKDCSKGTMGTVNCSHPDRISKSAKSKRSNIRRTINRLDFEHERKTRKAACFFHKSGHKVPGSYSENRSRFFKPSPAINVSSPSITASNESEVSLWTLELHFIWWVKVIRLQKSRKRFKSRRNYSYGWRSNSICVCDLDMLVQTQLLKESLAVLSLGKLCEEKPNTRPKLWATGSRHKLWTTTSDVWKQTYLNGFNHSRKDWRGDLQVRHASSSWRGHTTFRASSSKHYFNQIRRKARIVNSFPKIRIAKCSCESAMQRNSWRSGGPN